MIRPLTAKEAARYNPIFQTLFVRTIFFMRFVSSLSLIIAHSLNENRHRHSKLARIDPFYHIFTIHLEVPDKKGVVPTGSEAGRHRKVVAHKEADKVLHGAGGVGRHEVVLREVDPHEMAPHGAHHMVHHTHLEVASHSHRGEVADDDQTRHGDTAALDNQCRRLGCHKTAVNCSFGGEVADKTGA